MADKKRECLVEALERNNWQFNPTARELGLTGRGVAMMARRLGVLKKKRVTVEKWVKPGEE